MSQQPNFIYIGTSKAGSTWLFDLLSRHADVFMTPVKGLYFFDHHFEQGWPWYSRHFSEAKSESIVGEISHSYLYSSVACERIAQMNPNIKLMVCLREPMDRAFSMYLDGLRNGKWTGTFEERCNDTREIIEEGCYAKYLEQYLDRFSPEQIHITLFDDLKEDPELFAHDVFSFLGIPDLLIDERMKTKVMPACLPRNVSIVKFSKRISQACRRMGFKKFRGRVKRSRLIRSLLYRQVADAERAQLSDDSRAALRERFQPEVQRLDEILGLGLCERWGYQSVPESAIALEEGVGT